MTRAQYFLYFSDQSNLNNVSDDEPFLLAHNPRLDECDDDDLNIDVDLSELYPLSSSATNNY